jgi:hypothetical protein
MVLGNSCVDRIRPEKGPVALTAAAAEEGREATVRQCMACLLQGCWADVVVLKFPSPSFLSPCLAILLTTGLHLAIIRFPAQQLTILQVVELVQGRNSLRVPVETREVILLCFLSGPCYNGIDVIASMRDKLREMPE